MPNKTILFADDSATMREVMQKTFAVEPFDVVAVPSGDAAIQKAKEVRPSLIIADAGMVGVTGYDVCAAVRADAALAATPVVVMWGASTPYDAAKGGSVGVTEDMKKPFDTTKLIEKVGELMGGAGQVAAVAPAPAPAAAAPGRPPVPPTRPQAAPVPPARPQAAPVPAKPVAPPAPVAKEQSGAQYQVSTLAELAQIDNAGQKVAQEAPSDSLAVPQAGAEAEIIPTRAAQAGAQVAAAVQGVTPEQADAIRALTAEMVEKVVWEVVPDLAESMIREKIAQLLEE